MLDDGAIRNAARGRHALRQRLALADGVETGHRDRALRARVDRSVRRLKLGEQQRSAHQRRRVAEGGDGDVEPRGRLHSGREVRGDDDGRDIAVAERGAVHVKTQVREHRLDGLLGEGRVAQGVARPLQTDHEAITDELTVARAAQDRDILDPGRDGGRGGETKRERQNQSPHYPPLTRTEPSGWTAPDTVTPLSSLRTLTMSPIEPSCSAAPVVVMTRSPSEKTSLTSAPLETSLRLETPENGIACPGSSVSRAALPTMSERELTNGPDPSRATLGTSTSISSRITSPG